MKKIRHWLICLVLVGASQLINGQVNQVTIDSIYESYKPVYRGSSKNVTQNITVDKLDSTEHLTDTIRQKNKQLDKLLKYLDDRRPGVVFKKNDEKINENKNINQ